MKMKASDIKRALFAAVCLLIWATASFAARPAPRPTVTPTPVYHVVKIQGPAVITEKSKNAQLPEDISKYALYCTFSYLGSTFTAECVVEEGAVAAMEKKVKTNKNLKLISTMPRAYFTPTVTPTVIK